MTNEKNLFELDREHIIHPQSNPKEHYEQGPKIIFDEGNGIYLKDIEGHEYIDGVSMLWNVNLGHGNKELAEAAYNQMTKAAYTTTFYNYTNEPSVKLAEKITSLAPGDLNSIFYTSGGSESNDTAFKLSRFYWQQKGYDNKNIIISLKRGYHGVTIAAQRATGIGAYRDFSGVLEQKIINAEAHLTECELGDKSHPDYDKSISGLIDELGADRIAAIIIEPVQGAGGVHVSPDGYLQAVRNLCDKNDIHFIADEVICGFGRTGKMFGCNHWDVVPDFMCVAKGLTSGYIQLGGVIMRDEIKNTLNEFDDMLPHGFTYSGHPTACAVGLKNIEILERDNWVSHAKEMGDKLLDGLKKLEEKYSFFANPRAKGLLAGIDLVKNKETNEPFDFEDRAANQLITECFNQDLLIRAFDFEPGMNIVAIAPPLIVNEEEIDNIINIVDAAAAKIQKTLYK
jgi:putrescine aminotransferase